eukprot:151336_1
MSFSIPVPSIKIPENQNSSLYSNTINLFTPDVATYDGFCTPSPSTPPSPYTVAMPFTPSNSKNEDYRHNKKRTSRHKRRSTAQSSTPSIAMSVTPLTPNQQCTPSSLFNNSVMDEIKLNDAILFESDVDTDLDDAKISCTLSPAPSNKQNRRAHV